MLMNRLKFNMAFTVNQNGEVYSIEKKKVLRPYLLESGIWTVKIPDPNTGIRKRFQIHRLVAENFLANPSNKDFVTFKNEDKSDYKLSNLKWIKNSRFTSRFGDING